MGLSNYLSNMMIDFVFRGGVFVPPDTVYIALCASVAVSSDTGDSINEVSSGNYARQSILGSPTNWYSTQGDISDISVGSSNDTSNVNPVSWNSVTWASTIVSVAICDSPTGGNMLYCTSIDPVVVSIGARVTFMVGTLQFSFS